MFKKKKNHLLAPMRCYNYHRTRRNTVLGQCIIIIIIARPVRVTFEFNSDCRNARDTRITSFFFCFDDLTKFTPKNENENTYVR